MVNRITPKAIPIDVLLTSLHELHLRKNIEMVDTRSNIQLSELNSNPHGVKVSKFLLIVPSASNSILPHDRFTIINFVSASFIVQITSIVIKRRKLRSKRQKYPVYSIVLRKPTHIRYKKTAQLYYINFYRREYSDDYKSPAYFRPNILYL